MSSLSTETRLSASFHCLAETLRNSQQKSWCGSAAVRNQTDFISSSRLTHSHSKTCNKTRSDSHRCWNSVLIPQQQYSIYRLSCCMKVRAACSCWSPSDGGTSYTGSPLVQNIRVRPPHGVNRSMRGRHMIHGRGEEGRKFWPTTSDLWLSVKYFILWVSNIILIKFRRNVYLLKLQTTVLIQNNVDSITLTHLCSDFNKCSGVTLKYKV